MPEDGAARLAEDEIAQGAVFGDQARLLLQAFACRGRDAAEGHIADLTLSVAGDDVDDFGSAHRLAASLIGIDGLRESISSGAAAKTVPRSRGIRSIASKPTPSCLTSWLKSAATIVRQLDRYHGLALPGFSTGQGRSAPLPTREALSRVAARIAGNEKGSRRRPEERSARCPKSLIWTENEAG
jgi:hypothetical protein